MNIAFIFVAISILLNVAGQLFLKAAMNSMGSFNFSATNLMPIALRLAINPFLLSGLVTYGLSLCVWLLVLSRLEVSTAYPLMSLGFIINAVAAYYLFGEPLSVTRIAGIFIIMFGVYLVSRNA